MSSFFVLFEDESDEDNEERPIDKTNMRKRIYSHQRDRSTWLKYKKRLLSRRDDGTFRTAKVMGGQSLDAIRKGVRLSFSLSGRNQPGSSDWTEETEMEHDTDSFQTIPVSVSLDVDDQSCEVVLCNESEDDIDSFQMIPVSVSLNEDDQSCEVELCSKSENTVQTVSTERRPKILNSFRMKHRQNKKEERGSNDECGSYERTNFLSRKLEKRKTSKSFKAFLDAVTIQEDQPIPPPPDYPPPPLNTIEAVRTVDEPTRELDQNYQFGSSEFFGIKQQESNSLLVESDASIDTIAEEEEDLLISPVPASLPPVSSFEIRKDNKEIPNTTRYGQFNEFKYEVRRYNDRKEKHKKSLQRTSKSAPKQEVALQQASTTIGANLGEEKKLSNLFKELVSLRTKF